MKKYQVIGGECVHVWYGESDTLRGAKNIATRNREYWSNWQGWRTPKVYNASDCFLSSATEFSKGIFPKPGATPVCIFWGGKWFELDTTWDCAREV